MQAGKAADAVTQREKRGHDAEAAPAAARSGKGGIGWLAAVFHGGIIADGRPSEYRLGPIGSDGAQSCRTAQRRHDKHAGFDKGRGRRQECAHE